MARMLIIVFFVVAAAADPGTNMHNVLPRLRSGIGDQPCVQ